MKHLFFALLVTLAIATTLFAQKADDAKDALAVVNKLFDAMAAADAAAIIATGTAQNQLVAIQKTRDGKTRISVLGSEAFSKFFTKPGSVKEVMYAPKVEVSGDWAMVWGRYVFYVEGKLSHCGINQFQPGSNRRGLEDSERSIYYRPGRLHRAGKNDEGKIDFAGETGE